MSIRILLIVLFLCSPFIINAQGGEDKRIDSIKNVLINRIKQEYDDPKEKLVDYRRLGEYYEYEGSDSTKYYFKKGADLSIEVKDSFYTTAFYNRLSRLHIYYYENDDHAIKYADSALTYANRDNKKYFPGIAYSYKLQAESNYYLEKYDLALGQLLQANLFLLKDDQGYDTKSYLAENYVDLAKIYLSIENKLLARNCLKKSLSIAKSIEHIEYIADAYQLLSVYHIDTKKYELAKKYLDSSQVMYTKDGNQNAVEIIKKYRADIFLEEGNIDDAIKIYDTLLPIDEKENLAYLLTDDYLFLSKACLKKGNITMAKMYLDKSRNAAKESDNQIHTINIAKQQAEIYNKEKNYTASINELKKILSSEEINEYRESKKDIYKELYETYEHINKPQIAYTYFKDYNALEDSLRVKLVENRFNVLQTEVNYNELVSNLESKEAELKISEEEQKRIKQRDLFIIAAISLLTLFVIFSFFRQRQLSKSKREALNAKQEALSLKKEALDAEVRFKNQQITDFAIHISEKNELLEKVKSKLKSVKVINDSHKETVNDTIHFINNDIETDKEKIQLYQQIDETNDSFRAKIDRMYTNLNEKEKKVATMLRLGQTSKQIALQLGISSASVDNYRYNLRKKMEIPKGESLKNFIQNI